MRADADVPAFQHMTTSRKTNVISCVYVREQPSSSPPSASSACDARRAVGSSDTDLNFDAGSSDGLLLSMMMMMVMI